jgi:hypothetical protein
MLAWLSVQLLTQCTVDLTVGPFPVFPHGWPLLQAVGAKAEVKRLV